MPPGPPHHRHNDHPVNQVVPTLPQVVIGSIAPERHVQVAQNECHLGCLDKLYGIIYRRHTRGFIGIEHFCHELT